MTGNKDSLVEESLKRISPRLLPPCFDNIPMTWNDPVKIPAIDHLCVSLHSCDVSRSGSFDHRFMEPAIGLEYLEVEEQVGLDERLRSDMQESNFFVCMPGKVLVFDLEKFTRIN